MRNVCLILMIVITSGCAIKPQYAIQTATSLEVGVNRNTNKLFKLVDRNRRVISSTKSVGNTLSFSLPTNTSPNVCYSIIDEKGEPLFNGKTGVLITSVYYYNQIIREKYAAQKQLSSCSQSEVKFINHLNKSEETLSSNQLFNGSTCDLPPQRTVPPFPETICGSYSQCERLANDSCMKNLVDAEACGLAMSKTNVHSSITSVSCGALLSSLNGGNYGIGSGLQDALTGYLDEHTKNMIEAGEYGSAIGTGLVRLAFTYFRTESCKEDFTKAAYAPIKKWKEEKNYIEKEPYIAQDRCNILIRDYNSAFNELKSNKKCIKEYEEKVISLSKAIEKAKYSTSEAKGCIVN